MEFGSRNMVQRGKNDAVLCAIRVRTDTGYYWDERYGKMIVIIKLFGSIPAGEKSKS
jgi:hypothetical protein